VICEKEEGLIGGNETNRKKSQVLQNHPQCFAPQEMFPQMVGTFTRRVELPPDRCWSKSKVSSTAEANGDLN